MGSLLVDRRARYRCDVFVVSHTRRPSPIHSLGSRWSNYFFCSDMSRVAFPRFASHSFSNRCVVFEFLLYRWIVRMAGCLIRSFLHTPDHISMFRFHKDSAAECLPDPIPMTCIKNKKYLINDNPVSFGLLQHVADTCLGGTNKVIRESIGANQRYLCLLCLILQLIILGIPIHLLHKCTEHQ